MSGMEFCGICRGGPWNGEVLESDVRSWRISVPRQPKPLSSGVPLTLPRQSGAYVWQHPNRWEWHWR